MKKSKRVARTENQIVHLKEFPSHDQLPKQAIGICEVLKANPSAMPLSMLITKMKNRVESRQSMKAIWSFYRRRLIKQGFITVKHKVTRTRKAGSR